MSRKFKVEELLSEAEYRDYQEFMRTPARTVDEGLEWLVAKGYSISRTAVWTHKKNLDHVLAAARAAAEMARSFGDVVKETGTAGMNDAILGRFQQLQMEWAFAQLNGGDLTPEDMERFAKSMNQAANAAQRNQDLREKFDAAMKAVQSKVDVRRAITAEDIAEVKRAVFG